MLRRNFLGASAGIAALSASRVLGANDRINVGLIGCGGTRQICRSDDSRATQRRLTRRWRMCTGPTVRIARTWAGAEAKFFQDFRRLLDLKEIDAVHIATPDHWHAIAAVLACQAGKDVYVEKPTSLTVREGRVMVDAARKYNRIVQVGTQHRSAPHFQKIAEMIQRGDIGAVKFVRVWNYANHWPGGIGRKPTQAPPADLEWDMYLGPSPRSRSTPIDS
jgi:predicted dehydrogenase